MAPDTRYREIPYNYTSLSDREIILRYFDEETLGLIDDLRAQRVTGRSARLIAEVIGDIFIIDRNPYVLEDFLENAGRVRRLRRIHEQRLEATGSSAAGNATALRLVARVRGADADFFSRINETRRLRTRTLLALRGATARKNISFDPFDRIAHSTDATDWRVEHPFAVLFPESAGELPGIIAGARKLGLSIIPRGGGTGLTAGAVPVNRKTIVINMERLKTIGGISVQWVAGREIPSVTVEAGCVTEDVIEYCRRAGYIFATDPTSSWASTIGGNIAENAGGKKCVQWGTAIDNLVSWEVVTAEGVLLEIRRRDHPYRKILPDDRILFDVVRISPGGETFLKTIGIHGTEVRKRGLGKDVTNKALNGLPGIQKEGGDGIITRGRFVLYRPYRHCRTLCLEFFGRTAATVADTVLKICETCDGRGPVYLTALEHFDVRYVRAINYRNKSSRTDAPRGVLLIDVESDSLEAVEAASTTIAHLARGADVEAIPALDDAQRTAFWKDRKNLGAIARHTNAFKLNEDVVIPLSALPAFADFIERVNIDRELANAAAIAGRLAEYLRAVPASGEDAPLRLRVDHSLATLARARSVAAGYRAGLAGPAESALNLPLRGAAGRTLFDCFRDGTMQFSVEEEILGPLRAQLHGYEDLWGGIERIAEEERRRTVVIATHMHAGDGNIHVNIPVHSGDYAMMREANETAGAAIREAVRLGGVVSGEHGIGLTKLGFVDDDVLHAYAAYKQACDPGDVFNPGKLRRRFPEHLIYTPSFSLLELEAYILEATDFKELSEQIATCVRCGKCKPVCCTHIPEEGMQFNPRNKIMAVGQITEAVLYHAQTMDMLSFRHFRKLKNISDHCTVCHKCAVPCPVKIDFGKVTLAMRDLQARRVKARRSSALRLALYYLSKQGYRTNFMLRTVMFRPAYAAQRLGNSLHHAGLARVIPPGAKIRGFLEGRISARGTASLRERIGLRGGDGLYSIADRSSPVSSSVVLFPGCGSERLYPEISIAALAMLGNLHIRTFLPPSFTCCGYPFQANGQAERAGARSFENRIVFHRMADCVGSSEVEAILVSCGTCYEMLERYDLGKVFRNAPLMDINEFLVRKGIRQAAGYPDGRVLYHEPCHTPLKTLGAVPTVEALLGRTPVLVPECCGDAGTLGLSRPDISCVLRRRKSAWFRETPGVDPIEVLTTCPGCVAGLSKLRNGRPVTGKSLIVKVAEETLGKTWERDFIRKLRESGVERIPF